MYSNINKKLLFDSKIIKKFLAEKKDLVFVIPIRRKRGIFKRLIFNMASVLMREWLKNSQTKQVCSLLQKKKMFNNSKFDLIIFYNVFFKISDMKFFFFFRLQEQIAALLFFIFFFRF